MDNTKPVLMAIAALVVLTPAQLRAQCPGGAPPVGTLGIEMVACDCTIAARGTDRPWTFRTEPEVLSVAPGSAADGRVRPGDVITAVNGEPVTQVGGAAALAGAAPGSMVTLTVRRADGLHTIVLEAASACPTDRGLLGSVPPLLHSNRAVAAARVSPRPEGTPVPRAGATPRAAAQAPAAAELRRATAAQARASVGAAQPVRPAWAPSVAAPPAAWLGIAYTCDDCSFVTDDAGGRWRFSSPPEVYSVESGSPAHAAGMRRGDVVTHVDGEPITSEQGGRRWSGLRPGDQVRLQYRRAGATHSAALRATEPARVTDVRAAQVAAARTENVRARVAAGEAVAAVRTVEVQRLRFSGSLGNTTVEVRGSSSVVVTEQGNELIITTPDATIRVRVPPRE